LNIDWYFALAGSTVIPHTGSRDKDDSRDSPESFITGRLDF
jgi:hypothetical protein